MLLILSNQVLLLVKYEETLYHVGGIDSLMYSNV